VIGGLFSSTVLTLFLLPVLYEWIFRGRLAEE
jgi:Cu/Ag efflux pump CusA